MKRIAVVDIFRRLFENAAFLQWSIRSVDGLKFLRLLKDVVDPRGGRDSPRIVVVNGKAKE